MSTRMPHRSSRCDGPFAESSAAPSPYAGIPVSIKDLFDIKGQVTRAGSRALMIPRRRRPMRLWWRGCARAGFIVIGRTNMTEFAYSGIGINPHYGTPKSVWHRTVGHVPGGSSSGAAVSVADGMAYGALGTDTGGSCRIPAAYNGIVGFKPTQRRVPLDGGVPLRPRSTALVRCAIGRLLRGAGRRACDEAVPRCSRARQGHRLAVPTTSRSTSSTRRRKDLRAGAADAFEAGA